MMIVHDSSYEERLEALVALVYPYVTFVKISTVGFLPPPPPPPCSLDSPLPFFPSRLSEWLVHG